MCLQVKEAWKFNTVHPEAETQQKQTNKSHHPNPFDRKRSVTFPSVPTSRTA